MFNNSYAPCLDNNCKRAVLIDTENTNAFKKECEASCPYECDRIVYEYNIAGNEVILNISIKELILLKFLLSFRLWNLAMKFWKN